MLIPDLARKLRPRTDQDYIPGIHIYIKPHDPNQGVTECVEVNRLKYKNQRHRKIGNECLPINLFNFCVDSVGKVHF